MQYSIRDNNIAVPSSYTPKLLLHFIGVPLKSRDMNLTRESKNNSYSNILPNRPW